jgi:2'-5' RNA ligase
VPVVDAAWFGRGQRTLVLRLKPIPELAEEYQAVTEHLGRAGLKGIEPQGGFNPHLAIGRVTEYLEFSQKREIAEIIEACFDGLDAAPAEGPAVAFDKFTIINHSR